MIWAVLGLVACKPAPPTEAPTPAAAGLVGDHPLNPFPVGALHTAGGRVALSSDDFGLPDGLSPIPVERLAWRTGFSPAQTSVLVLPQIDASTLPSWREPTPGAGGVRLADLTAGVWLPVMAELDAHPRATEPTLLVRPLVAVPVGHEVAVVVTTAVAPRPERFAALLSDAPPADLSSHAGAFRDLVDRLGALGVPSEQIAIAWSYPVGDGTAPLRSGWSQVSLLDAWTFDDVRDAPDGVAPRTWRAATGTYAVPNALVDDLRLRLAEDGSVSFDGEGAAAMVVHIPPSVADAPAGSVPVLLFGHGIFSEPAAYLDDDDDGAAMLRLADEGGFIVVGTEWRGLSAPDRLGAIAVAQDFGRMHEITDRLVQAQINVATLFRLMQDGSLFDDPVFQGAQGQRLPDATQLRYYGISLGGIQGAVMLANDPPVPSAALHVGGSTWSTMLERSSNWPAFEIFMDATVPDPLTRQRVYALSQLWWDAVDPISYTAELSERTFILQEALGDEQVPNMTTRALARSVGLPLFTPSVEPVWGLDPVSGPLPAGRALVQFDPELPLPPDANRPAPITGAHDAPRRWTGTVEQLRTYLSVDAPGRLEHHCGAGPCTASEPGD